MSDHKLASLITVGAPKSAKNNVNKTLRLSIDLDESNESKYPELNYKDLVIAAARKKKAENCKKGLDPFSDDDNDEIEKVVKKFEQKYGANSTYGKKDRSKYDDLADIGAGYDENNSFIDNTDGYDEIVPPECDTTYGGFYINSGKLEFKIVQLKNENNKRRISSSSSEEESSQSSSDSDSLDAKDPKAITNGNVDSHETEHRKKKNKNIDKQKAKKVRRTDSSAATSGKQTSDENVQGDAESADSRTSQSDSLTSKPAPSSETAATSDSSRDAEAKVDIKLPTTVNRILEELETLSPFKENLGKDDGKTDACIVSLERALSSVSEESAVRAAWVRAGKLLGAAPDQLRRRAADQAAHGVSVVQNSQPASAVSAGTKRKMDQLENTDCGRLTVKEREAEIEDTLRRLKVLIEEREPGMLATYNAECERVEEERRRRSVAAAAGAERRRPKRRFPWCARARTLLSRLAALGGAPARPHAAAALLAERALPLFPDGFVRMPTLLKQADLNKDIKASDLKRQRVGSMSQAQPATITAPFTEPIQFPSSLTVTTSVKTPDKTDEDKFKSITPSPALITSFTLNKDLVIEKPEDRKAARSKEDYIPSNSIGSITITPVPSKDKKVGDKAKEPLLRVKSPAALNEMIHKKDKPKKPEKIASTVREKRVDSPLHIETSFSNKKDTPSPKVKEEISQKLIESMRLVEENIPRPTIVSKHPHSPTFAKPDKRPPEVKKKKEVMIVSDMDPLSDALEPLAVDDSSSDVEVIEDKDKSEPSEVPINQDSVSVKSDDKCQEVFDETAEVVMRNLREMAHSQEPTNPNCNTYGGVITSGKMSSKQTRREELNDKLNSFFQENGWD